VNIYNDYLNETSKEKRSAIIRTIKHKIKSCGVLKDKAACDLVLGSLHFEIDSLTGEQVRNMAILALYVRFGYNKYFGESPEWVKHPALYLSEPHFGRGYKPEYLYVCPQECLDHNVFIDVGSLGCV